MGRSLTAWIIALLLVSCTANKVEPPELVQDRTACSKCKMLVSETQYAAGFNDGESKAFDDIGCMLAILVKRDQLPEHIWVRDVDKNTWLDARHATYVYSSKQQTPMNYGYVAVGEAGRATQLAQARSGKVLTDLSALVTAYRADM